MPKHAARAAIIFAMTLACAAEIRAQEQAPAAVSAQETAQSEQTQGGIGAPESPASQERFDVWEYRVENTTLLPKQDIERAVYGHLGPNPA